MHPVGSMTVNEHFELHLCTILGIRNPAKLDSAEQAVFYKLMSDFEFDIKRSFSSCEEWDAAKQGFHIEIPNFPGFSTRNRIKAPDLIDRTTGNLRGIMIPLSGFVPLFLLKCSFKLISYRNDLAQIFKSTVDIITSAVKTQSRNVTLKNHSKAKVCNISMIESNLEHIF